MIKYFDYLFILYLKIYQKFLVNTAINIILINKKKCGINRTFYKTYFLYAYPAIVSSSGLSLESFNSALETSSSITPCNNPDSVRILFSIS